MQVLRTIEALIIASKQSIANKEMMLTFTTDETSASMLNVSIAFDKAQLQMYYLQKTSITPSENSTQVDKEDKVIEEAPKRQLSPAQKQWQDEVSAVMKELPDLSIEEARREASRRREGKWETDSEDSEDNVEYLEIDELDEFDNLDDEEYVEEKRPQSFLQKKWNKEVADIMKDHPEWSIKEASKEASLRRGGKTPKVTRCVEYWADEVERSRKKRVSEDDSDEDDSYDDSDDDCGRYDEYGNYVDFITGMAHHQ